jgi:hypothetical protein
MKFIILSISFLVAVVSAALQQAAANVGKTHHSIHLPLDTKSI